MQPFEPDERWSQFISGIDANGEAIPFAHTDLVDVAARLAEQVDHLDTTVGPGALLATARSLVINAWWNYEFLAVACLVGFHGLEAAFRDRIPEVSPKSPLATIVAQAHGDGVISDAGFEHLRTGVKMRNRFSHPATQIVLTLGAAEPILAALHSTVGRLYTDPTSDTRPA